MTKQEFDDHVERPTNVAEISHVQDLVSQAREKLLEARRRASNAELIFTEVACGRAIDNLNHSMALLSKGA